MMSQIPHVAPAFLVWIVFTGGSHDSDALQPASQPVLNLQRDQQEREATMRRGELVFGSNKAGDYYEGAFPP